MTDTELVEKGRGGVELTGANQPLLLSPNTSSSAGKTVTTPPPSPPSQSHVVNLNAAADDVYSTRLITLTWRDVVVNAPVNTPGMSLINKIKECKKEVKTPTSKLIINHVDGIARPKEILAIMGASGAGKTTLLNVLNFRNRGQLTIDGQVCVNGQLINEIDEIASISGYVQQDDLFVGSLTVKENLIFQAMLRMDKKFTPAERYDRVEQVLQDVSFGLFNSFNCEILK
jgi:ABC-type multidrug transport system fused ATPase/permease subunit